MKQRMLKDLLLKTLRFEDLVNRVNEVNIGKKTTVTSCKWKVSENCAFEVVEKYCD